MDAERIAYLRTQAAEAYLLRDHTAEADAMNELLDEVERLMRLLDYEYQRGRDERVREFLEKAMRDSLAEERYGR